MFDQLNDQKLLFQYLDFFLNTIQVIINFSWFFENLQLLLFTCLILRTL